MLRQDILCTVVFLLLIAAPAIAYQPLLPYSYKKPSADGQYLFVMVAPHSSEFEASSRAESIAVEIKNIRNTYKQSGLYQNDGTTIPIWTVDWYAHNVEPLSDGVHLVRLGLSRVFPYSEAEAVAFFANGQMIRSYLVRDLITDQPDRTQPFPEFRWLQYSHLDDQNMTYTVMTQPGGYYKFDVTTGKIIMSFSLVRWISGLSLILVLGGLGYWWRQRKQHA